MNSVKIDGRTEQERRKKSEIERKKEKEKEIERISSKQSKFWYLLKVVLHS